jgi:hypothetical protein
MFLFKLISSKESPAPIDQPLLVVPVRLQLMYEPSDLEQAAYFHIEKGEKQKKTVPELDQELPRTKKQKPQHGTTMDVCDPGDPGLI